MELIPFEVHVDDAVIDDLRARLRNTRWPDQVPGSGWDYGADGSYLRDLCAYWAGEFDWRAVEARLNAWPQFTTQIDGQRVHFIHARSPHPRARPLLLVHGWPSSQLEFLKVLAPLTDPVSYSGDAADAFHVVAPSIPGYAWSGPTTQPGWDTRRIAAAFTDLMRGLGYHRFGAFGTDMGSPITTEIARTSPGLVTGLHLTLLVSGLRPKDGVLTAAEEAQAAANNRRRGAEIGYVAIQSTKPQTLAYGLTDSPAGQAAWIVEKLRNWTDCGGDLESVLSKDEILATVMTYWVTGTAGSSARLYYEMARAAAVGSLPPDASRVEVPTAVAVFPGELYPTSQRIASDHYAIERWTVMPRGGHFAALEVPDVLVEDLRAFFRGRA
jgi:microsomal epoxide hydrolase